MNNPEITRPADTGFYRRDAQGGFSSSPSTAGPWSASTQHGGPPSALLGRAFEECEPREDFRLARVTLELPRPVPVGELAATARIVRSGARTELLEGELTADGRVVMTARAWRLPRSPHETPTLRPAPPIFGLPDPQPPHTMKGAHLDGYIAAMEWRFPAGAGFDTPGPGEAWARQRIPLVEGEPDTPITRALTLADSSWAVAFELDHVTQLVINNDVTLALHRDPIGEWLGIRSETAATPQGSGLASGILYDQTGECGRILQTLLVASR